MGSIDDISQLCRLCLVKDQVNIPIFDENSDIEQAFVKINSCLPVKVSPDDNLPKKICDGCSYKLDMLYTFRNTSVDSEKQLISWLDQAGLSTSVKDPLANTKPEIMVKQETFEPTEGRIDGDNTEMGVDAHSYIMQQQQLPYQQDFDFAEASGSVEGLTDEPPPKRAKRAAALKKAPLEEETEEEDLDAAMQITKAEEEDDEDVDQPDYVEAPSTSADDQPGPSGVSKGAVEAPVSMTEPSEIQETIFLVIDDVEDTEDDDAGDSTKVLDIKKRERVVCHECGNLVTWNYLATHMYETHYDLPNVTDPRVLCPECGIFCKDNRSYAMHKRSHLWSCNKCPEVFPSQKDLEEHVPTHNTKKYVCDKCDCSFDDMLEIILHNETHSSSGEYLCINCSFKTTKTDKMKRHMMQHETRPYYTCDTCAKKFFGKAKFETHLELHMGIPKYVCEYCPKKFSTMTYLKTHRDYNHQKQLYGFETSHLCRECGRKFKFEKSLKRHLSTIHKIGEDRTVSCPICLKVIANNYNLKVHMRTHTGETIIMCDLCGKGYNTYKSYKKHVLKHHPGVKLVPLNETKRSAKFYNK